MRYFKIFPIVLFSILVFFLYWKIKNIDESKQLSSALLNKNFPYLDLETLEGRVNLNELIGKKGFIVNYFASWCAPCRIEHEVLKKVSKDFIIVGIGYKDTKENINKFIKELGNPYELIMMDYNGTAAIELGLYGVPESYLVNRDGIIKYRQVGPLTEEKFNNIVYLLYD